MTKKFSKVPPIKSSTRVKNWSLALKKPATASENKSPEKPPSSSLRTKPSSVKKQKTLQQVKHLEEDLKEINSKYQFLMAEYANYKKQTYRQMEHMRKYEGQHLILELLNTVMDDFDRAINLQLSEKKISYEDFRQGINLIYQKLQSLLLRFEVKELPSQGKSFDPEKHSALSSVASEKVPPDHIVSVVKKAYTFRDKLIREASVIVSKKPDEDKKNA